MSIQVPFARILGNGALWRRVGGAAAVAWTMRFGALAQQVVPSIEWEEFYHQSASVFYRVVETRDGGYILGGEKHGDCILVKTGRRGEMEWEKAYGGSGNDVLRSLRQTADGGYVFAATSDSPRSGNRQAPRFGREDVWVVKLDAAGNAQWDRSLGIAAANSAASIWQAEDGGYIVAGFSPDSIGSGYWLMKLNTQAERDWLLYPGGRTEGLFTKIIRTADGGYAFAGFIYSESEGSSGILEGWAMKVDVAGVTEWEQVFGGAGNQTFFAVEEAADGGLILGGRSHESLASDKPENWVVKVNMDGSKEWERSYGSEGFGWEVRAIRGTTDGGYILGGISGLIKIDANGRLEWRQPLGRPNGSNSRYVVEVHDLRQTKEGGFIVAGRFDDPSAGAPGIFGSWMAKVERVASRSGEVITWTDTPAVVLEWADELKSEWRQPDWSMVLRIGEAAATRFDRSGKQRFYRLHSLVTHINAPSLAFGSLLTWPSHLKQQLEILDAPEGDWQRFSGAQGTIGDNHYAVIPANLRQHYFRTRKAE